MGSQDCLSPLVVEKSEVVLVKPSKATPDVSLSLSTIDNYPTLEEVIQTISVFVPKPYLTELAKHHLVSLIQHALSHTLVYYYPLAGKVHRKSEDNRLQVSCKVGDGVPFVRATATCTLASLSYLDSVGEEAAYQLVPSCESMKGCEGYYDPLALQVTIFACGGITIGTAHLHSVTDGLGMAQFFRALIELASGKTQPTIIPVWERERLSFNGILEGDFPKSDSSTATSSNTMTGGDMAREILHITSEDITELKKTIGEDEQITSENEEKVVVTTLEILAAQVWRARCRALNISPKETAALGIAIGIRGIMEPALPEGYYGNAVVNGFVELTAGELSESSLPRLVRLIRDMKRSALDKEYVLGVLSEIERGLDGTAPLFKEGIINNGFVVTDWRQVTLQQSSEWGDIVNTIPLVSKSMPFLCVLLPTSKASPGMSGGVRVLVTLPRDVMAKFKEEMKSF